MLRISKMTDYATVLLARLAAAPDRQLTAAQLAAQSHLGAPTVSKVLKQLHRRGLVSSTLGLRGGYRLVLHGGLCLLCLKPAQAVRCWSRCCSAKALRPWVRRCCRSKK